MIHNILATGKVPAVTIFSVNGNGVPVATVKSISPKTKVVLRVWDGTDYQTNWNATDLRGVGQSYADNYINQHIWPVPDNLRADYHAIINEPGYGQGTASWWQGALNAFESAGFKLCVLDFGVGIPELDFWKRADVVALLRRVKAGNHIMGLHEYVSPASPTNARDWTNAGAEWYALRHQQVYALLPADARPTLVCTEYGDEGGRDKGDDWLIRNMAAVDAACKNDTYLLSMNLWTLADNGPGNWETDRLDGHEGAIVGYYSGR